MFRFPSGPVLSSLRSSELGGRHSSWSDGGSFRPKRISCELPKGSQLFYASIAAAAKALCCRGLGAFDFGQGALSLGIWFSESDAHGRLDVLFAGETMLGVFSVAGEANVQGS